VRKTAHQIFGSRYQSGPMGKKQAPQGKDGPKENFQLLVSHHQITGSGLEQIEFVVTFFYEKYREQAVDRCPRVDCPDRVRADTKKNYQ